MPELAVEQREQRHYRAAVTPTESFLEWLRTEHHQAAVALHNGDAGPKVAVWSVSEPVTVLGAFWVEAANREQALQGFARLADKLSDCRAYSYDLIAYGVSDDLAYTVGYEHASMRVEGVAQEHHLRVTQVYRREPHGWRVVHRHADEARPRADSAGAPTS